MLTNEADLGAVGTLEGTTVVLRIHANVLSKVSCRPVVETGAFVVHDVTNFP